MRGGVLITDGDQRASLACVRSLGRAGYRCCVLGPTEQTLAGSSRFAHSAARCPDPSGDPEGFFEAVRDRSLAWGCDVLIPITEKSLRVLLPRVEELKGVTVPFPRADVFSAISDKSQVLAKARSLGFRVPRQVELGSVDALDSLVLPEDLFPVAVKPTRSVARQGEGIQQQGVTFAPDLQALQAIVADVPAEVFPLLVQERIEGSGVGVFLLLWGGELRACVGHRRMREKPPSGGVSVVRESTTPDPELLNQSMDLLSAFGWEDGVAMVEYKIDRSTGESCLMEINGRFWGSLQLAIDAGVDFPTLLLRAAGGKSTAELVVGKPGVITRWLLGDLDQVLLRVFRSRVELDLPECEPGRLTSVFEFLRDFRPGVKLEVLRLSDFRPFLRELSIWFRGFL